MEAERWQKIERIFHATLQADPSRRSAILEDSCAADESLRREVESLRARTRDLGPSAGALRERVRELIHGVRRS